MYKLLLSILLMTLIGGSLCAIPRAPQTDQEWERFRSVKEGFSVLFPEQPTVINRGQYRKAPVRGARNYAAYRDGVVYFLLVFDNPDHEKPLEYFLESQLPVTELRDTEVSAGNEISNGSFKGQQYSLKKYDYRKSFSYPGSCGCLRQRIVCWHWRFLEKMRLIRRWDDFFSRWRSAKSPTVKTSAPASVMRNRRLSLIRRSSPPMSRAKP